MLAVSSRLQLAVEAVQLGCEGRWCACDADAAGQVMVNAVLAVPPEPFAACLLAVLAAEGRLGVTRTHSVCHKHL